MPTIPETMESLLKELTAKQELSQKLLDELRALKEGPTFHNQLRALELHEQLLHLEAERIGIKVRIFQIPSYTYIPLLTFSRNGIWR